MCRCTFKILPWLEELQQEQLVKWCSHRSAPWLLVFWQELSLSLAISTFRWEQIIILCLQVNYCFTERDEALFILSSVPSAHPGGETKDPRHLWDSQSAWNARYHGGYCWGYNGCRGPKGSIWKWVNTSSVLSLIKHYIQHFYTYSRCFIQSFLDHIFFQLSS